MFRRAGHTFYYPYTRSLQQQVSSSSRPASNRTRYAAAFAASGLTAGAFYAYSHTHRSSQKIVASQNTIELAKPIQPSAKLTTAEAKLWDDSETLRTLIWGDNKHETLEGYQMVGDAAMSEGHIRYPSIAKWLDNVALKDLQLHKMHAACVDANGDVYQWGHQFFGLALKGAKVPVPTLKGKNIVKLQLTEHKVFALSSSGTVYVLAADALSQEISFIENTKGGSWWGGNRDKLPATYKALTPTEQLGWGEKFVSISAGEHHLLALTNKGRTFAHPVDKEANHYGQLGIRHFEIADPTSMITGKPESLKVELQPMASTSTSIIGKARDVRITPPSDVTVDLSNIDDSTVYWCTHLYEIPSLRGVQISQIATGSKTSFVRTPDGRVLGWGANNHGQIGLGQNVTLEAITVPMEVTLWRIIPSNTRSKCLNVTAGGDLTAFIIERSRTGVSTTVDLMMCGDGKNGGLGNNTYSSSQSNPVRVKGISGLLQFSDRTNKLEAIQPTEVIISPTGHVLTALDSSAESHGVGGQDLMAWGKNYDYELGNGKKASVSLPATLEAPNGERLMLLKKEAKVFDLEGQLWKNNVSVQQHVAAGFGNSVVYWKIVG